MCITDTYDYHPIGFSKVVGTNWDLEAYFSNVHNSFLFYYLYKKKVWFKNRRAKCRQQAKQQPMPSNSDKLSLASRMKSAKKIGGVGPAGSTGSNGTSVATSLAVSSALKSSPRSTPSRDSPFDSGKNIFFKY